MSILPVVFSLILKFKYFYEQLVLLAWSSKPLRSFSTDFNSCKHWLFQVIYGWASVLGFFQIRNKEERKKPPKLWACLIPSCSSSETKWECLGYFWTPLMWPSFMRAAGWCHIQQLRRGSVHAASSSAHPRGNTMGWCPRIRQRTICCLLSFCI